MGTIEQKILAFRRIHTALKDIIVHDKCSTCKCLHGDVLAKIIDTLKGFNRNEPQYRLDDIEADFERWTKDFDLLKAHG